jgi:electron transfer flavoprotein beta subunit
VKILVCIKRVPFTGGKMVLNADASALETRHLGFTISPHEECGVEEAVRLIEASGGESVVLTLGPAEAVEQLRDAMALGIDRGILLQTDGGEWDGESTAAAIVEAIRADESSSGAFDLIFFGNESADAGGYQVGLRVAYTLGRPCATGLKGVKVEGATVRCEQDTGAGRDVYVLPLPAVVTVKEGLNLPRYPSVPGRMRAARKPVATFSPERPLQRMRLNQLSVPGGAGRQAKALGSGAPAAPAVVAMMRDIGII